MTPPLSQSANTSVLGARLAIHRSPEGKYWLQAVGNRLDNGFDFGRFRKDIVLFVSAPVRERHEIRRRVVKDHGNMLDLLPDLEIGIHGPAAVPRIKVHQDDAGQRRIDRSEEIVARAALHDFVTMLLKGFGKLGFSAFEVVKNN